MQILTRVVVIFLILFRTVPGVADVQQTTWQLDNLARIGGVPVTASGDPRLVDTPCGKAIEFDGVDDAIFLDMHPLEGLSEFTVEVIFKPYRGGAAEQRFFHMQETGSESRVMFETRLVGESQWFLDTFARLGEARLTLYANDHRHDIGPWFHAAIVASAGTLRHYVNGRLELSGSIPIIAPGPGRTSLGARMNRVHWYKGAIHTVRVTAAALGPDEFFSVSPLSEPDPPRCPGTG